MRVKIVVERSIAVKTRLSFDANTLVNLQPNEKNEKKNKKN